MEPLEITLFSVRENFIEKKAEQQNSFDFGMELICARKGIWEFHKYDDDYWPSIPHGHDKENPPKINIYTGEIYHKKTKKYIGKMKDKYLREMQKSLKENDFFTKEQLKKLLK